ncbi:Sensor protein ZraS [compost metagenome]
MEVIHRASFLEALSLLQERKFSVIVAEETPSGEGLRFLTQALQMQPMAPRFFMGTDLNESALRDGINRAQIFRFMKLPVNEMELKPHLEKALQKHSIYLSRSTLLKEASHKNKQLEALTHSLEQMVEERTQYIEQSHQEETDKLARERHLIRFIKDLAAQTSFEDILVILRKELRKFHKLGDPILAYRLEGSKTFFLSFQSGNFTQTEAALGFDFPRDVGVPPAELIRHFANHFGRPFVKAWMMPLELRLTRHLTEGKGEALLCVENSLSGKEATAFVDFMTDRMGPLSMALDRVLLENQLSSFSYRWEKTFDGMRDPVAIVDVEYNVIRANRKFSDKFLNHKCYETFASRGANCDGCPVPQALLEGKPQVGQIKADGRIYQVHSYPIRGEQNGKTTNVVNQYVDITQSRELYLHMLQSEKMGAIGMLAGNIAHELNNPLTGLRSLSQVLLQETEVESTLHADLLEIEKAAARSQRIIKNLLEFSKEEQASEYISVDEIVERTMPMLKSALRTHRTEMDLKTLAKTVFVEPHLLQQVVFNLINNACQAMKDSGKLRVATRFENKKVILEIEDTGPGIPDEIKGRIFEAFFTTKKEGHGTGLGLSMSKQVIEKFGGRIEFKNVEPHGTCFVISLPQMDAPRK